MKISKSSGSDTVIGSIPIGSTKINIKNGSRIWLPFYIGGILRWCLNVRHFLMKNHDNIHIFVVEGLFVSS